MATVCAVCGTRSNAAFPFCPTCGNTKYSYWAGKGGKGTGGGKGKGNGKGGGEAVEGGKGKSRVGNQGRQGGGGETGGVPQTCSFFFSLFRPPQPIFSTRS